MKPTAEEIMELLKKVGQNTERCVLVEPRPDGLLIDWDNQHELLLPYFPTREEFNLACEFVGVAVEELSGD